MTRVELNPQNQNINDINDINISKKIYIGTWIEGAGEREIYIYIYILYISMIISRINMKI